MTHLHTRFTDAQVRVPLSGYCQGLPGRADIHRELDIGKTRLLAQLKQHRQDRQAPTWDCQASTWDRQAPTWDRQAPAWRFWPPSRQLYVPELGPEAHQ